MLIIRGIAALGVSAVIAVGTLVAVNHNTDEATKTAKEITHGGARRAPPARRAHSVAVSGLSASVARLWNARASSRPGSSPASTSTASRPARSDSAMRPPHQIISESAHSATASLWRSPSSR